MDYLKEIFGGV